MLKIPEPRALKLIFSCVALLFCHFYNHPLFSILLPSPLSMYWGMRGNDKTKKKGKKRKG
jgi:hypothetical protein